MDCYLDLDNKIKAKHYNINDKLDTLEKEKSLLECEVNQLQKKVAEKDEKLANLKEEF